MSDTDNIAARDVKPGMLLYNSSATNPVHRWVRVKSVSIMRGSGYVVIKTSTWETWKHPGEGVSVRYPQKRF